jgi:small subunit ribosomal protein S4
MRRIEKKFKKPRKPWDKERIEVEKKLMKTYGLRRKREIWKAESILRSFRRRARDLAAKKDKAQEKILLEKLQGLGLLGKNASLDDVLSLTVEDILERRLQTIVFKNKLANTPKHARQLITHGHVAVDGRRTVYPSFLVPKELEKKISLLGSIKTK